MMVSSKGRYALRVMLDLAERSDGGYIRLSDIARRQNISRKYLESIMPELCRCRLVESALGKSGGYRLTRAPADYRVGEILSAAEKELAPVACLAKDAKKCERSDLCYTLPFWQGLEEQIRAYVNRYSLQDLLDLKSSTKTDSCGCTACSGKGDNEL